MAIRSNNPFKIEEHNSFGLGKLDRKVKGEIKLNEPAGTLHSTSRELDDKPKFTKIIGGLLLFIFTVLLIRSFSLQIVQGAERLDQSENNRIKIELVPAMRGIITDRAGQPLVKNIPNFILFIVPDDLPKDDFTNKLLINDLANQLEIDNKIIFDELSKHSQYSRDSIYIADNISYQSAMRIITSELLYPGITIKPLSIRDYLNDNIFSHVLGYVGKVSQQELDNNNDLASIDYVGKSGLEEYYDSKLRGKHGYREVERDFLNHEKRLISSQESTSGLTLHSTIDLDLQKALYQSLASTIKQTGSSGGAVVALDPRNGEVLALISEPSYNPNNFVKGLSTEQYQEIFENPDNPFINRAITGEYPSGSTIKPIIASAALEEHIITPQTQILSTGGIQIDQWFFPDWKSGGHGLTDLTKALSESVNTYFYTIGGGYEEFEGLGVNIMNVYMKLFGFSEKSGIDLSNEQSGFLPTKEWKEEYKNERWYVGDTYHYAIGQGDVLVTPLQIANATSVIANGGTLYRPRLVKDWQTSDGQVVETTAAEIITENIASSFNLVYIRNALRQAVVSGSASRLNSLSIPVAGKTGTAQVSGSDKTHSWFTAFAPYDSPEIVITAIVEKGGEGHTTALPVVQAGLFQYFSN
ncbi:MAG: penicillin-binding protein 2 [bacterium]